MIDTLFGIHDAGYPVVVIPPGRKGPTAKNWPNKRYTRDEIVARYERTPDGNWGILLGPDSGIVDLEGDAPESPADCAELFEGVDPPATPTYQSSRGIHRLYAWDDRFAEIGKAVTHYKSLEIRIGCGKAAQSLIPPSQTGETKREWIGQPLSADFRPARLPDAVIDRILASAQQSSAATACNADKIIAWLERGGITPTAIRQEADFTVIDLPACPFKQQGDGHTGLLVFPDGLVRIKCFHAKCADKSLADLEALIGPYDGPRVIVISPNENKVIAQAVASLASAEGVYQRGGQLVQIVRNAPTPPGIDRPDDAPRIAALANPTLRKALSACATWTRQTKKSRVRSLVPDYVSSMVAAPGNTWPVPRIEAIYETPFLRRDGSIVNTPGYDAATGAWYEPTIDYPSFMPVDQARDLLLDIVTDFPFATEANKSAWLASLLTPFARLAFAGPAPLFAIDGNSPGCGKGLLANVTGIIATGREMSAASECESDAEWRKRITGLAAAGEPLVLLDNVKTKLDSAALDAALTSTTWTDRLLGRNEIVTLPMTMTWFATGNNIILGRDTARRVCHIRLQTPLERPEERDDFRHPDLLGYVQANRAQLAIAALSILHHYAKAGRPDQHLTPWGSFEGWSNLVRSAIVWAGLPDPGETRLALAESADTDSALLSQLLDGWQEIDVTGFGLTAAEAIEAADQNESSVLRAAINELDGGTNKKHALGIALRTFRGRVCGGRKIDRAKRGSIQVWRVTAA